MASGNRTSNRSGSWAVPRRARVAVPVRATSTNISRAPRRYLLRGTDASGLRTPDNRSSGVRYFTHYSLLLPNRVVPQSFISIGVGQHLTSAA
eukprot:scaffold144230_cov31-Prasinocladus_malaysianus.AAC.1